MMLVMDSSYQYKKKLIFITVTDLTSQHPLSFLPVNFVGWMLCVKLIKILKKIVLLVLQEGFIA